MAQKVVLIPSVGQVTLVKKHGNSHLRLSVTAEGRVRVSLPYGLPYSAAVIFAKSRAGWINAQTSKHQPITFTEGALIGKAHRLYFIEPSQPSELVKATVKQSSIEVVTSLPVGSTKVQEKVKAAAEQALKSESTGLLIPRLAALARQYGLSCKDVKIRKLTSRWGSCSNSKVITLSYYLIQLPWELIDYVILHELTHTVHLHHGRDFWEDLEAISPNAKRLKKEIKQRKPRIEPA